MSQPFPTNEAACEIESALSAQVGTTIHVLTHALFLLILHRIETFSEVCSIQVPVDRTHTLRICRVHVLIGK